MSPKKKIGPGPLKMDPAEKMRPPITPKLGPTTPAVIISAEIRRARVWTALSVA